MIPLHALVLLLMGRFSSRLYVAYSSWYAIGTLSSMQVPFVGFQPVRTSEHMAALGEPDLLRPRPETDQMTIRRFWPPTDRLLCLPREVPRFFEAVPGPALHLRCDHRCPGDPRDCRSDVQRLHRPLDWKILLPLGHRIRQKVGARFRNSPFLISNSEYLRYIPIIASVSEHQPTAWPSFFMDLQFLVFLFPAGVVLCFRELRDEHVFVIIYALVGTYFAGVMVRLMLTLTPCVCVAAAVALSTVLDVYIDPRMPNETDAPTVRVHSASSTASSEVPSKKAKRDKTPATESSQTAPVEDITTGLQVFSTILEKDKSPRIAGLDSRFIVISVAVFLLVFFVQHCTWVTSYAYSSPSVVLASRNQDGSQHIIDDFREAYYWLRQNTKEDAVVMSWWDYGYQIAGMADRPTLVDNNTWNNSQYISRFLPLAVAHHHGLQPTSPPSEKPCHLLRKSHTPSFANTTWNTF